MSLRIIKLQVRVYSYLVVDEKPVRVWGLLDFQESWTLCTRELLVIIDI